MFVLSKIKSCNVAAFRLLKANLCTTRLLSATQDRLETDQNHKHEVESIASSKVASFLTKSLKVGPNVDVNTIWLRENCRCGECYNFGTHQRNVLFHKLQPNSFAIKSLKEAGEGDTMEVLWEDGHTSFYDKEWLRDGLTTKNLTTEITNQFFWNAEKIIPYINDKQFLYESWIKPDKTVVKAACQELAKYGLLLVHDVPKDLGATITVAEKLSNVKETIYGRTWQFSTEGLCGAKGEDTIDSSFTDCFLNMHTDGNYYFEPPSFLVLHCLKQAEEGGETLLSDGFKAANDLQQSNSEAYGLLSKHLVNFNYKDSKRHLTQVAPTIELDQLTGQLKRIRYNHYDRSPYLIPEHPSSFYNALHLYSDIVEKPENIVKFQLEPGTVMIIDNWRLLHGRTAFKGTRAMCGCYMDRDEWLSHLRVL